MRPRVGPVGRQLQSAGHHGSGRPRAAGPRWSPRGLRPGSTTDSVLQAWAACHRVARAAHEPGGSHLGQTALTARVDERCAPAARKQIAVHLRQGHAIHREHRVARGGPLLIASHTYSIARRSLIPNMPPFPGSAGADATLWRSASACGPGQECCAESPVGRGRPGTAPCRAGRGRLCGRPSAASRQ